VFLLMVCAYRVRCLICACLKMHTYLGLLSSVA